MAGGALSFREDPFRLTPDRRFIFSTDGFRRAFDAVLDGARNRRGIVLLTGPSGTGKTTLLQALREELQRDGAIIFLRFHPGLSADLMTSCLTELGSPDIPVDEAARIRAFIELVKMGTRAGGPPAVLVIDEAGQFSDAQLSDLYRLAAPGRPLAESLQVVLAALPSFEDRLRQSQLAPLQQAIAHRARLQPLRPDELAGYITHRCSVAGIVGAALFETAAVHRIYDLTRGTPRLVNRLCSAALFVAHGSGMDRISVAVIDDAAAGCDLSDTSTARSAERKPAARSDTKAAASGAQAAAAPPPPPSAVHPRRPAAATAAEAVVLAEAERAWVKAVLPPIGEVPPPAQRRIRPDVPPAPPVLELTEPAPPVLELTEPAPAVLELTQPAPPILELTEPLDERAAVAAARRRLPSLRIAASIALVATSGVALGSLYWPAADRETAASSESVAAEAATTAAAEPVSSAAQAVAASAFAAHGPTTPPAAMPMAADAAAQAADLTVASRTAADTTTPSPGPTTEAAPPAPVASVAAGLEPAVEILPAPAAVALMAQTSEQTAAEPQAAIEAAPAPLVQEPTQPAPPSNVATNVDPPARQPEETAAIEPAPASPGQEPAPQPSPPSDVATNVDPPARQPEEAAAIEPAAGRDSPGASSFAAAPSVEPTRTGVAAASEPSTSARAEPIQDTAPAPHIAPASLHAPLPIATAEQAAQPPLQLAQAAIVSPAEGAAPAELAQLMTRGDEMMRIGDPASARLFYERAAARGLARGFTAVGRTYDPVVLQQLNIRGGGANGERALDWYRRGVEAGDADAGRSASDLSAWLARRR